MLCKSVGFLMHEIADQIMKNPDISNEWEYNNANKDGFATYRSRSIFLHVLKLGNIEKEK